MPRKGADADAIAVRLFGGAVRVEMEGPDGPYYVLDPDEAMAFGNRLKEVAGQAMAERSSAKDGAL